MENYSICSTGNNSIEKISKNMTFAEYFRLKINSNNGYSNETTTLINCNRNNVNNILSQTNHDYTKNEFYEKIDEDYSKDNNYFYFRGRIMRFVNPDRIQILGNGYLKDDNNIYYCSKNPIDESMRHTNAKTWNIFKNVDFTNKSSFPKVKAQIYGLVDDQDIDDTELTYDYKINGVDIDTFEIVDENFAKDKDYYYLNGKQFTYSFYFLAKILNDEGLDLFTSKFQIFSKKINESNLALILELFTVNGGFNIAAFNFFVDSFNDIDYAEIDYDNIDVSEFLKKRNDYRKKNNIDYKLSLLKNYYDFNGILNIKKYILDYIGNLSEKYDENFLLKVENKFGVESKEYRTIINILINESGIKQDIYNNKDLSELKKFALFFHFSKMYSDNYGFLGNDLNKFLKYANKVIGDVIENTNTNFYIFKKGYFSIMSFYIEDKGDYNYLGGVTTNSNFRIGTTREALRKTLYEKGKEKNVRLSVGKTIYGIPNINGPEFLIKYYESLGFKLLNNGETEDHEGIECYEMELDREGYQKLAIEYEEITKIIGELSSENLEENSHN